MLLEKGKRPAAAKQPSSSTAHARVAARAAGRHSKRPVAGSPRECLRFCRRVPGLCDYDAVPLLTIAQEAYLASSTPNKPILTLSRSLMHPCSPAQLRPALRGHAGHPRAETMH
jgi:hypothetical protein